MFTKDIVHSLRSSIRRPGSALWLVLILAVGIGFVTLVFSLADSIFLARVPFEDADRIVLVMRKGPDPQNERDSISYPNLLDWVERNQTFEGIAASSWPLSLTSLAGEYPEGFPTSFVDAYYFEALKLRFAAGRGFTADENLPPTGDLVVVISHRMWQSRFGGDPGVIGESIVLEGYPYTIVGVLGEDTRAVFSTPVDLMVPFRNAILHSGLPDLVEGRARRWLFSVGRLKPGVTVAQAQADLLSVSRQLQEEFPEINGDVEAQVIPFADLRSDHGNLTAMVTMFGIGAAMVFVLSCINVILLLLARFFERLREFAVRMALGAGRGSLILQGLAEIALIALIAGAVGFCLASLGVKVLFATTPLELPDFVDVQVNIRAFLAALLATLGSALLFGLVPAWCSSRVGFQAALRPGAADVGAGRSRNLTRRILVIVQVAVSTLVLVGAFLMIRSFQVFNRTEHGFRTENLLFTHVGLAGQRYAADDARRAFYRSLEEQLSALPGVSAAGLWGSENPAFNHASRDLQPEGREIRTAADRVHVWMHIVSPGAPAKLGLRLLRGRGLEATDDENSPGALLVSESAARALWPNQRALGKRVTGLSGDQWFTVVGVVADARHRGRALNARPIEAYATFFQVPWRNVGIFLRFEKESTPLYKMLPELLRDLDSTLPLSEIVTMEQMMEEEAGELRFFTTIMILFAATAALLTTLGIYGVMSYTAGRRTREIALRTALGAGKRDIAVRILAQTAVDLGVGIAAGVGGAFAFARIISSLLYGVPAADPLAFLMTAAVMALVAVLATTFPTRRALSLDPGKILRYE